MAKKLWGGRFQKQTNPLVEKFTESISFDKRLAKYDVLLSIAHAKMLGKCKIISGAESQKLVKGLGQILKEVENGKFVFDPKAEDIHTAVFNALLKKQGAVALKLHTARSRNDQVVTDLRMYCKDEIEKISDYLIVLQRALVALGNKNKDVIIPGYTHTQMAMPVLLAHHLLAYAEGFERDKARLCDAYKKCDAMPLGSCALAGTSLPIDRLYTAKLLGFSKICENSMDAVSDRDFVLEILADLSILGVHISRLCEDLVLWSTQEFAFIDIDDAFCTGSSIMPHKKNPDVPELLRGKSTKALGCFVEVATMMKGLAMTYNRDMQMDKQPLFDAIDNAKQSLQILAVLLRNISINTKNIAYALKNESLFATDIAEYLVKKGVAFSQAHQAVGSLVNHCLKEKIGISDVTLKKLKLINPKFDKDVYGLLSAKKSVEAKRSLGSTSNAQVLSALKKWEKRLS